MGRRIGPKKMRRDLILKLVSVVNYLKPRIDYLLPPRYYSHSENLCVGIVKWKLESWSHVRDDVVILPQFTARIEQHLT